MASKKYLDIAKLYRKSKIFTYIFFKLLKQHLNAVGDEIKSNIAIFWIASILQG